MKISHFVVQFLASSSCHLSSKCCMHNFYHKFQTEDIWSVFADILRCCYRRSLTITINVCCGKYSQTFPIFRLSFPLALSNFHQHFGFCECFLLEEGKTFFDQSRESYEPEIFRKCHPKGSGIFYFFLLWKNDKFKVISTEQGSSWIYENKFYLKMNTKSLLVN